MVSRSAIRPLLDVLQCSCVPGFTGSRCEQAVSPCESAPCLSGGTCIELSVGGFSCLCPADRRGVRCDHVIEPGDCQSLRCLNGGTCVVWFLRMLADRQTRSLQYSAWRSQRGSLCSVVLEICSRTDRQTQSLQYSAGRSQRGNLLVCRGHEIVPLRVPTWIHRPYLFQPHRSLPVTALPARLYLLHPSLVARK